MSYFGGVVLKKFIAKNKYTKSIFISFCFIILLIFTMAIKNTNNEKSILEASIIEEEEIRNQYQSLLENLFDYRNKFLLEKDESKL